jgi:hypothetical protein
MPKRDGCCEGVIVSASPVILQQLASLLEREFLVEHELVLYRSHTQRPAG